jgi:PEP-CTERM motif-containing protein
MKRIASLIVATALLALPHPAKAQFQANIDENGGGSYFGPNGEGHTWGGFVTLSSPPVYHLEAAFASVTPPGPSFIPTPGDILISESATAQIPSDLLRFDANGNLTVFSDKESSDLPPFDLADVGVPAPGTNVVSLLETDQFGGPAVEGKENGIFGYQAAPGTPGGFPAGTVGTVVYNFISDAAVPEPSTFVLAGCGMLGLLAVCRMRRATHRVAQ